MKALKLDHASAELVRSGSKTVTWRIYDDKDIHVNDEIELIDKVDPKNPDSWRLAGHAKVTMIVEKPLHSVTDAEQDAYGEFRSREEMLESYQQHYGAQVDLDTPVKMVYFRLIDEAAESVTGGVLPTKEAKLFTDGGSRGNPGPSAGGFVVTTMDGQVVVKKGVYLGLTTNNQAEYQALKLGLEEAHAMGVRELHVYMDSLLVVNQMLGVFKIKNRDLWPIYDAIKQIMPLFKQVSFTHIPRELNKIADGAVNEALDEAAESQ